MLKKRFVYSLKKTFGIFVKFFFKVYKKNVWYIHKKTFGIFIFKKTFGIHVFIFKKTFGYRE